MTEKLRESADERMSGIFRICGNRLLLRIRNAVAKTRVAVKQIGLCVSMGEKLSDPNKAILLPNGPHADIIEWLESLGIKIIWREKEFSWITRIRSSGSLAASSPNFSRHHDQGPLDCPFATK